MKIIVDPDGKTVTMREPTLADRLTILFLFKNQEIVFTNPDEVNDG